MPYCARLTYGSTTTSMPATLRQDLTDILEEARRHNFNHQLHGVLYYGNNYFFQCLEGQKAQIDALYEKLLKDRRHKDIVLLSYHEINQVTLAGWDLKFVLNAPEVQQFYARYHWEKFNPYCLKDGLIEEFLEVLLPHTNMEVSEFRAETKKQAEQSSYLIKRIIPWLIMLIIGVLVLLYLYDVLGSNPVLGIGFFNGHN